MSTILVYGLPGSGKTTFATKLKNMLGDRAIHFNGDNFRKFYNDWDFSEEGRRRQAERMRNAALNAQQEGKHAILDFVCPKEEYRDLIDPDYRIHMKCTPVREFSDTTAMFEDSKHLFTWKIEDYDDSDRSVIDLYNVIMDIEFDYNAPTALMIGRYQPFHEGHKALFVKALEKHGQVCIAVRDMPQSANNPYTPGMVEANIHKSLQEYRGKYQIVILPNIVDVVYGRDVGWTVSKIDLPPEIESISATNIRKSMNTNPFNEQKNDFSFSPPSATPADIDLSNNAWDIKLETPKIFESPDKGKTIYERDFGSAERTLVKTSVQQQWKITFNGTPIDEDYRRIHI